MARSAQQFSSAHPSLEYLRHLGPHRVSVGELSAIGIPGVVFTPETGPRCPAIVFGHGYLQPVGRYADTLRYLASWGFVAAAPASEAGPIPSHQGLALDMLRTADRLCDAKLGGGRVTVDRNRLGAAGHGIGGSAAVLAAAAGAPPLRAVVTIAAAPTSPSPVAAAAFAHMPALHITSASDEVTADTRSGGQCGDRIARSWAGSVQLRHLKGSSHLGMTEGPHWTSMLLGEKKDKRTQRAIRVLLTSFLLAHVAGQHQLDAELDGTIAGSRLADLATPNAPEVTAH